MEAILFMGLQASGKSTFFKERFCDSHVRINMDMLNTRNREKILLHACIEAQQKCVVDNTNLEKSDRERYIVLFKKSKFKVIGYYFQSKVHDCVKRNQTRELLKPVPDKAIYGASSKLELPDWAEGFDELYYVSIGEKGFEVKEWGNEV